MSNAMDSRKAHIETSGDEEYELEEANEIHGVITAVPVWVENNVTLQSPESSTHFTRVLQPGVADILLPQDPSRQRATISVSPAAVNSSTSQANGSQTSPSAGTIIASLTVPVAGVYEAAWTVALGGTTSGTDANNFELFNGATGVLVSMNGSGSGTTATQSPVVISVAAGATVSIQAVATGTVSSVYKAQLVLTQMAVSPHVVLCDSEAAAQYQGNAAAGTGLLPANPMGTVLTAGSTLTELDGEVLYAANSDPVVAAYVTVVMERRK